MKSKKFYKFNKEYEIYENGFVYRNNIKKKASLLSHGYLVYQFYDNISKKQKSIRLHRLLAEHFISNPNNYPCVNHKDGNKTNNALDNLEWCTHKQNSQHAGLVNRYWWYSILV